MGRTNEKMSRQLKDAKGTIRFTLRNDVLFRMVMGRSAEGLKGLVCCLKGLDPEKVRSVEIMNPIDLNKNIGDKEIILDIRVCMNDEELLDIELQMYYDPKWEARSLLYAFRTFDSLKSGESYNNLKPVTLIVITNQESVPEHPRFCRNVHLVEDHDGYVYSNMFSITEVNLHSIELATEDDKKNGLERWARMFLAETWEELYSTARNNPAMEEVAENMYSANSSDDDRYLLEARERAMLERKTIEEYLEQQKQKTEELKQQAEAQAQENEELEQQNEAQAQRIAELEKKLAESGLTVD